MARRPSHSDDGGEEEPDPEDEAEDEEPSGPPRRRRRAPVRTHPVRRWRSGKAGSDEEGEPDDDVEESGPPGGWLHRPRRTVLFRARDSLYFEPLIAVAIVALLLVCLYAYAQNWPPAYVVESGSMQHGPSDTVGLINTGDLVIAEKVSPSQIVPYVVGTQSGYRTYGEYGDVILYHPNGSSSDAPIIHRAIVYIAVAPNGSYSIPELQGMPCGTEKNALYNVTSEPTGCGTEHLTGGRLVLYRIGWMGVTINLSLAPGVLGSESGYLTMGDNNFVPGNPPQGLPDQPSLTPLVQPGWIIGVARGMIPWFGAIKLLLSGSAGMVPSGSWEFLGLTVVGILLAGFGIHYALRAEGIEDERRREMEAEEEALEGERPHRRWSLRRGKGGEEEDDEDEEPKKGSHHEDGRSLLQRLQPWHSNTERKGGRPAPSVKRGKEKRRHGRSPPEDEEL